MFNTPKPKIRQRTVKVPVKKPSLGNGLAQANGANGAPNKTRPPASRYALTPSTRTGAAATASTRPAPVSGTAQRKRKVAPPSTPQFASSDESSEDDDLDRKRQKTSTSIEPQSSNRCLEPELSRRIWLLDEPDETDQSENAPPPRVKKSHIGKLIHGAAMSSGDWAKEYKPAFPDSEPNVILELQYPSLSQPEKFEAVVPRAPDNFNALDDIYFSIEEIVHHYFPPDLSAELLSETTGPVRLLKRAATKQSLGDFTAALNDFNTMIKEGLADGTIAKELQNKHAIPLSLTKRILAQVYQRTVSPHAHKLRGGKEKETTYGELLPGFVHKIFQQTHLNSSHVFVDLGSGVGNVVLQSALQTGAESWGIELLDTPAKFALDQAAELRARAQLWNINLAPIYLRIGDFFNSREIDDVLRRADVVLVNNKVFKQDMNINLLSKFLDLKMGAKVVSLVSFGVRGHKHGGIRNEQSIANLFDEERFESGTNSVSWAGESVEYFIATKVR